MEVKIVEVGPRDGLQNEPLNLPTAKKAAFIRALEASGLRHIEVTSFVNPKKVPQLADAAELFASIIEKPAEGVIYSALTPNMTGLERAIAAGARRIAVFTAASESFTRKNLGMDIAESLRVFADVVKAAKEAGLSARGYISTAFVCPYEGDVAPERVRAVALPLLDMGVDELAVSDTIGAACPNDVERVLGLLLKTIPVERIALHFHDTYGTALANVYAGLRMGATTFDASAGGLGGCPFAPGAAGNLATEDLVYFLDRMGIECGVSLAGVAAASRIIQEAIHRTPPSRQFRRMFAGSSGSD